MESQSIPETDPEAPFGRKPNGEPYKSKATEESRARARKYHIENREKIKEYKRLYVARKREELKYYKDLLNYSLETL